MKLINAETVKEYLNRVLPGCAEKIDKWVDAMPAAEHTGFWYEVRDFNAVENVSYECSECGGCAAEKFGVCPFCGAVMDTEENEHDGT